MLNAMPHSEKQKQMVKQKVSCQYCCKQFQKRGDLQKHLRVHTGERPYSCDTCHGTFSSSSNLINHKRSHLNDGLKGKQYHCGKCNAQFYYASGLVAHEKLHDPIIGRPYACGLCTKRFRYPLLLCMHMQKHYTDVVDVTLKLKHKCRKCGLKFASVSNLCAHRKLHAVICNKFLCHICGQSFQYACLLKYHLQKHHSDMPVENDMIYKFQMAQSNGLHTVVKFHACSICGKQFKSNSNLHRHIRSHSNAQRQTCTICGQQFAEGTRMERHAVIHTGERSHLCTVCNKSFTQASSLKRHFKTHDEASSKK